MLPIALLLYVAITLYISPPFTPPPCLSNAPLDLIDLMHIPFTSAALI
mgnify:CR=1 FL=1